MAASKPLTPKEEFIAGFRGTLPLVVGAIPFGIIFGAVAVASGLSPAAAMAMSAIVFAGSAQFIATGLIATGAGAGIIILTTFVVNLRHALYGATLSPNVKHLPQKWLLPMGFWLTDETFVVAARRYNEPDSSPNKHWYYLGSAIFMYTNWQLMTALGVQAGQAIPDPARWGLDFAMVVTFIGMLIPSILSKPILVAVLTAAIISLLVNPLPNRLGLIFAAIAGVTAGVLTERFLPEAEERIDREKLRTDVLE